MNSIMTTNQKSLDLHIMWELIRLQRKLGNSYHKPEALCEEIVKNFSYVHDVAQEFSLKPMANRLEFQMSVSLSDSFDHSKNLLLLSDIRGIAPKYPNIHHALVGWLKSDNTMYCNHRNHGFLYEAVSKFEPHKQIAAYKFIVLNFFKYGILMEKSIKFLEKYKESFNSQKFLQIAEFVNKFNPTDGLKLGKSANKLFVIYKRITPGTPINLLVIARYLSNNPYLLKGTYQNFRYFLDGLVWCFPTEGFIPGKFKFPAKLIAPSFFITIGKLSTDLRWAAIQDRYSVEVYGKPTKDISSKEESRGYYYLNKSDINWEAVKEVQDLRLNKKMRLLNNHSCFPRARGFMNAYGITTTSSNIPSVINHKALKILTAVEYNADHNFIEDLIKVAQIFGAESKVIAKRHEDDCISFQYYIHIFVNRSNIVLIDKPLPQQWNQFFLNNLDLAQYANHVTPDMELFKSPQEFSRWVASKRYDGVEGFESLTEVCGRNNLTQQQFNMLKSYIQKGTNKTSEMLPFVRIDGSTIPEVGHQYIIEKLDSNDPLALIVGVETDCCQHIQGVGKPCAIHSWEQSDSAIYVLRKNGQVVAQSWVWRNTDDGVVFDSIEAKRGVDTNKAGLMFKALADALIGKLMIDEVYIGNTSFGVTRVISDKHRIRVIPSETTMISPCSYMDGKAHTLFSKGVW